VIGNQSAKFSATITGRRVLPSDPAGPKIETSVAGEGIVGGAPATTMGTYWSIVRADGTMYGEGQGVVMTSDGSMATWRGNGVGKFTDTRGAVSFRGAVYFESSQAPLSNLNGVACVYEWDVDAAGNGTWNIWEWK